MAQENIIINISANAESLKPTVDLLVKLGQISAKDAEEFKKLADQSTKLAVETKKAAEEATKLSDSLPGGKKNPKPSAEAEKTTTAFKSLKTQLSEAKTEAARLAQTMGEFSPQAIAAAQKAAGLDDKMKDLNKTLQALNPDQKLGAFLQLGAGIAGAFTAAQGALALFGSESEDVQKAILKVQGALALTQGLQSVLGLKDAFRDLRILLGITSAAQVGLAATTTGTAVAQGALGTATTFATTAFNKLKIAIASNPFGAIATILATVLATMILFDKATEDSTDSTNDGADALEEYNNQLRERKDLEEGIKNLIREGSQRSDIIRGLQREIELLEFVNKNGEKDLEILNKKEELIKAQLSLLDYLRAKSELGTFTASEAEEQRKLSIELEKVKIQIEDIFNLQREMASQGITPLIPQELSSGEIDKLIKDLTKRFEELDKPINDLPDKLEKIEDGLKGVGKEGQLTFKNILGEEIAFTKEGLAALEDFAEQGKELFLDFLDTIGQGFLTNAENFEIEKEQRLAGFDEEEERLQELNNNKIISDGLYAQKQKELAKQREATEKELNKKIAEEKRKAFLADRAVSLIKIAISTAENAVKLFGATIPPGILSAIAIAFGVAQAAIVSGQPIPKFAKGVIGLQGEGTGTSDSIPAMLSRGESVMTAQETKRFEPTLLAIRKNLISPEILNSMAVNHQFGRVEAFMDTGKLTRANRKIIPHQADAIGKSVAHYMNELNYYSPLRN